MIDEPRYSTTEVCKLASLSYRQADYLAPWVGLDREGSGARRLWSPRQVVQAFVVSTLMRSGRRGVDAASVAQLVNTDIEFVVVPANMNDAFVAEDPDDVLEGLTGTSTIVIRLPHQLQKLISGRPTPRLVPHLGEHVA